MEEIVQQVLVPKKLIKESKTKAIPNIDQVMLSQNELTETFSTKVKIAHKENGRGRIEIPYSDFEELNRLMTMMKTIKA